MNLSYIIRFASGNLRNKSDAGKGDYRVDDMILDFVQAHDYIGFGSKGAAVYFDGKTSSQLDPVQFIRNRRF